MKTEFQNQVILRLRKLREKRGFSQSKIALILGLSVGQIGNIETPNQPHKYTLAQIETLCKFFNVPIASVFYNDQALSESTTIDDLIHKIVLYLN